MSHITEQGGSPDADGVAPAYPISSVDNALRLLHMFSGRRTIRVAEASRALDVGRSTAHRLLAMLQAHGFVEQDPETRAYRSGPALVEIGLAVIRDMDIRSHVLPYMQDLCAELGETVHLMVLKGADCLFLEGVEAARALRTASRVGSTAPAHCTSGGKALLAEGSPARLHELFPSERLATVTDRSIATRTRLETELEQVRRLGYAVNFGESEADIGAVAVVVRNSQGRPRAAMAVSAPLSRLTPAAVEGVVGRLKRAADLAGAGLA